MIGRVFIPQVVERYDEHQRRMVPAFDFSAAAQYGELTPILEPGEHPMFLARFAPKIRAALADFDGDRDFLLAVGDPGVIAICSGLILRRQKYMKMLKWDRKMRIYIPLEVNP